MKKILLIGDSIRLGYDRFIKNAFESVAEVYSPEENCRFSTYVVRNLLDWKQELNLGDDMDLVHWNCGLWDCLIMLDGKPTVSFEVYKENIERICNLLKILFPKAKMIFATSTPVQEELFENYKRYNRDTEAYNKVACEIVKKHGGYINDLYTLMKDVPITYYSDMTHFYTKEAEKLISNKVIESIEKVLEIKANPVDYEKMCS